MSISDQLFNIGPIGVQPFRLLVRRIWATHGGGFVRIQTQPGQRIVNLLLSALNQPGLICVFNAQHELPASLLGPSLIEQRHVRGADVGIPRRARRDAGTSWLIVSHERPAYSAGLVDQPLLVDQTLWRRD